MKLIDRDVRLLLYRAVARDLANLTDVKFLPARVLATETGFSPGLVQRDLAGIVVAEAFRGYDPNFLIVGIDKELAGMAKGRIVDRRIAATDKLIELSAIVRRALPHQLRPVSPAARRKSAAA